MYTIKISHSNRLIMSNKHKHHSLLLKIAIVGECRSGKTLFCKKLTETNLSKDYVPTIALDMFILRKQIHDNINVKAHLWDTSGSKSYYSLIKSYFRACCAAIIVIDMSQTDAFEQLVKWTKELKNVKREDGQKMVFGVFIDTSNVKHDNGNDVYYQIDKFCKKENIQLYNVELRKNINIEQSMIQFLELINSYYTFGSGTVHGLNYYTEYDDNESHTHPLLGNNGNDNGQTINSCCSIL